MLALTASLPAEDPMPTFPKGARILFQGDSITDGNRGRSADPNRIPGHGYQFMGKESPRWQSEGWRQRGLERLIAKLGFARRIVSENGAAMPDLPADRMSTEPYSPRL